jgi:tetratricopeptide (TPR) repeat protein
VVLRRTRKKRAVQRFDAGLAELRAGRFDECRRQLTLAVPDLDPHDPRSLQARFVLLDHPEAFPTCDAEREAVDRDWRVLIADVAASAADLERLLVGCRAGRAGMNLVCGLPDEAAQVYEATAAWRREHSQRGDCWAMATAYGYCTANIAIGEVDKAVQFLDQATAEFADGDSGQPGTAVNMMRVQVLVSLGLALQGRVEEARPRVASALTLPDRLPEPVRRSTWTWLARPVLNGAWFYRGELPPVYELRYSQGAWWSWTARLRNTPTLRAATDFVVEYLTEFADRVGSPWAPMAKQDIGTLLVLSGQPEEGLAILHAALQAAQTEGPDWVSAVAHDLAVAYLLTGDPRKGVIWLDTAVAEREPSRRRGGLIHERAAAHGALGRIEQAFADYETAQQLHIDAGRLGDAADCEHNLAVLRMGRVDVDDPTLFRSGGPDSAWPALDAS